MAGAAIMKEYFDKQYTISSKSSLNDLVTEVDHKSEEAIFNVIKSHFHHHNILSEESGPVIQESHYKWIIDPIDGTINYANGIPICCVSIGLERDGIMEMGAVYNPFLGEFFFAQRGFGATLNNKKIHVSDTLDLKRSCLATGFPYTYLDAVNGPLQVFEKLVRKGIPVRRIGSAAIDLCWVAAGRFDGFYEHKLQAWDSAAGLIIVLEAGGKVTDLAGKEYNHYEPGIIASNGLIHESLYNVVNGGEI
jgi:myo-inositol-1(or 4)-monophosphatase